MGKNEMARNVKIYYVTFVVCVCVFAFVYACALDSKDGLLSTVRDTLQGEAIFGTLQSTNQIYAPYV